MTQQLPVQHEYLQPLEKKNGTLSYPIGGFYLLREKELFTFIRCGRHKDRPAQADNLHVDIWVKGVNMLRDSGTYRYNTTDDLLEYFMGSASHNTVTVADKSQMLKGSRFIWYFWSQAIKASWRETPTQYFFEGEISAFRFLNRGARHCRKIIKQKDQPLWTVEDRVTGLEPYMKKQLWHTDGSPLQISAAENGTNILPAAATSWRSDYYGSMEQGQATAFVFTESVTTQIKLQS